MFHITITGVCVIYRYRDQTNERDGHANGQHHVDGQHRLDRDRVEPRVVLQQGFRIDVVVLVDVIMRAGIHRFLRIDERWRIQQRHQQNDGDFNGHIRDAAQGCR